MAGGAVVVGLRRKAYNQSNIINSMAHEIHSRNDGMR